MPRAHLLAAGLLLAALVAGCGSEDPGLIPPDRATALTEAVDDIEAACEDGEPDRARAEVRVAQEQVTELPGRVDRGLRRNLREWLDHIAGGLDEDCKPEETPTPSPTETPTETPSPTPTETPTVEPTPEATETPLPEPTVEPPGDGGVPAPEDDG